MQILTINCGSSSLKFELRRTDGESAPALTAGQISGIGTQPQITMDGLQVSTAAHQVLSYSEAVRVVVELIAKRGQIDAVAHRIVHGGAELHSPVLLDDASIRRIEAVTDLAPLHNRPALEAIRAARQLLRGIPMCAVFDTAFHATMPEKAKHYAIDWDIAERHQVRRFGFHGLAHQYMTERYMELTRRPLAGLKLITLQLGSGCSATAVRDGRAIDTSMGLTPLEGLIMETRSGDIDPSAITYLSAREGWSANEVETLLNERSGLKGVSGLRDMRDILAAETRGDERAALAIDMFVYRIQKYIGAYLVALGGSDAIVFGGGIGENAPSVRSRVATGLSWIGLSLDEKANAGAVGSEARISNASSTIDVWSIAVDEGRVLASEAARLLTQTHR